MDYPTSGLWSLIVGGSFVMTLLVLRTMGQGSFALAQEMVDTRRAAEAKRHEENLAAEAAGRAASLEPLALNADGSIEEPILGVAETPLM